jgi:hypothetical protein
MAFTLGKKGTEWNPRDPRNRHIAHLNPGGGDNPPSDPATTAAAGVRNIDRGVLSAAATSVILDLRSPTDADADTGEEDDEAVASPQPIVIDTENTGWNCPSDYLDYKLTWARFLYYRDWILQCTDCTDGIMVTDYRDAYFQADPFRTAAKMGLLQRRRQHSLLVFEEHPDNTNEHWLTDLPVMACRKYKVGPTPVLCSGGTMGTRDGILDYLRVMAEEFEYWMSKPNCRQQG